VRALHMVGSQWASFVTGRLPKAIRVKLSEGSYRDLHQQILRWHGCRCQLCGSMHHLEVHHVVLQ
jgi:hypothetical protein